MRVRPASSSEEEPEMTQIIADRPLVTPVEEEGALASLTQAGRSRLRGRVGWLEGGSRLPTYVGVVVTAVGFALIALAWAKIAALTDVALQLPYLVSAGLTGLALVMVGLIVINIAAKRQDAAERARQMQALNESLSELAAAIADAEERR